MRYKKRLENFVLSFICVLPFFGAPINASGSIKGVENGESAKLASLSYQNNFSPTELIVRFSSNYTREDNKRTIRKAGAKTLEEIPGIDAFVLEVENGQINQAIEYFQQQENVVYAEPNYIVGATEIFPNDPDWSRQYNLVAIRAPAGWSLNTGAVWVTIAVLDSGVDLSHPDLFVRILPGYDFVNGDADPQDDYGHGTSVAAIAAASSNNYVGIAGVNWGANILPVKVLNASGFGSYSKVATGIVWATDHGAQVINLSLGGPNPSFVLNDAVNYAYQRGVILVASSGNAGISGVLYPAAYDPVIAVGATDTLNDLAGFSNYGPEIDLVAPGVGIYSAFPGGGFGYQSGTSMSAPHVSGFAALLIGIPGNGPARIENLMKTTALDLGAPGWDSLFGYGLIQMDEAIRLALPVPTQVIEQDPSSLLIPQPTEEIEQEPPILLVPQPFIDPLVPTNSTMPSEDPTLPASAEDLGEAAAPIPPAEQSRIEEKNDEVHSAGAASDGFGDNMVACAGSLLIFAGAIILIWIQRRNKWDRIKL